MYDDKSLIEDIDNVLIFIMINRNLNQLKVLLCILVCRNVLNLTCLAARFDNQCFMHPNSQVTFFEVSACIADKLYDLHASLKAAGLSVTSTLPAWYIKVAR